MSALSHGWVMEPHKPTPVDGDLGELISKLYAHFLALYGDEEMASVATASVINDLLFEQSAPGSPNES